MKIRNFAPLVLIMVMISCAKERPYEQEEKNVDLLTTGRNGVAALPVSYPPGTDQNNGLGSGSSQFTQQTVLVGDLDRSNDVLYVSSTQGVPRFTQAVAPYVQGKERVIQLFYTEHEIKGYVIEDEKEFQDNLLNNDPIISIPVEYKAFRCRENANKECTGIEEENNDANVQWYQKDYVLPKFGEVQLREYDSIGIENSCYTEQESELVHHEVNGDMIYFEVKKTYKRNLGSFWCKVSLFRGVREWDDYVKNLNDNDSFETIISFSMNRVNKITTPDYQAINYKTYDQYFYGYFKSVDYNKGVNQEQEKDYLLNRWAPAKDGGIRYVDYYLSREFNKPNNRYLKDATFLAFDRMNASLEHGEVNLRLRLHELTPENELKIRPGDMRYTMVVLIEDIANRLLGYGPSVANPYTGEIIKAHTNMYKGTLERAAPRVYDNLVALEKLNDANRSNTEHARLNALSVNSVSAGSGVQSNSAGAQIQSGEQLRLNDITPAFNLNSENYKRAIPFRRNNQADTDLSNYIARRETSGVDENIMNNAPNLLDFANNDLNKELELIASKADPIAKFKEPEFIHYMYEQTAKFAENAFSSAGNNHDENALRMASGFSFAANELKEQQLNGNFFPKHLFTQYHEEMMNFDSLGKVGIDAIEHIEGIRDENGKLKDWSLLTDPKQAELTQILVTHYYIPTLIHEIGHNLGLRHNFRGSTDKSNYYSEEERRKLGIVGEARYSSIMDYNHSSLNGLSTFGPYDLAAFRYGYNRTVDTADGSRVAIQGDILNDFLLNRNAPSLKRYEYCTDENAGASLTCDRFDEGADDLELTNHFIESYYNYYKYTNRKNRSTNFTEYGIGQHIVGRYFHMMKLRRVHEKWQAYYDMLQQPSAQQSLPYNMAVVGCTPEFRNANSAVCATLDKLIPANERIGRFFLDIIKTPQWTCHFRQVGKIGGETVPQFNGRDEYYAVDSRLHSVFRVELGERLNHALQTERVGFTLGSSCFDESVFNVFKNFFTQQFQNFCNQNANGEACEYNFEMVGEIGKPLNDVDAATRFVDRQYASDIEVRGLWAEKLLAAHLLTFRHNLVTAGSDFLRSFIDHPLYRNEINNLVEHLAYGRPLMGVPKFTNKDGGTYEAPTYDIDLNERIEVANYTHDYLNWVFGTPTSDATTGGFELAPYLLKQIANSSFVESWDLEADPSYVAQAKSFHDNLSAWWTNGLYAQNIADEIKDRIRNTYTFEDMRVVRATTENRLASYMIENMDVLDENGAVKTKGKRTLDVEKIQEIETRLNGPAPAPAAEGAAAETEQVAESSEQAAPEAATPSKDGTALILKVYQYKALYNVYATEVNTLVAFSRFAQENPQQLQQAIQNLQREWGAEKFNLVFEIYESMGKQDISDDEKTLRDMDIMSILHFLVGDAGKRELDRRLRKGLYNLPMARQRTNNSSFLYWYRRNIETDN